MTDVDAGVSSSLRGRPPSMADVAREAGVSHQTVSRVVNGRDNVRDETRARVQEALDRLGYRRNRAARMLATTRSQIIGVVTTSAAHGPSLVLQGVEAAARAAGYVTTVASLDRVTSMTSTIGVFRELGVDGMVVIAPDEEATASLRGVGHPLPAVVVDGGDASLGLPVVATDQRAAGRLATEHLLGLGRATVHHVAGPPDWYAARGRRAGWRDALEAAGAIVPPVLWGDWEPGTGYDAGRRLAADPDVTAVFAANDQMALGVLRALSEAGRGVPDQVAVVGVDDEPESAYYLPPLTSVTMDHLHVGRRSVALLLDLLEGRDVSAATVMVPGLVVRASTSPGGG